MICRLDFTLSFLGTDLGRILTLHMREGDDGWQGRDLVSFHGGF
jgi:hypothetical protein